VCYSITKIYQTTYKIKNREYLHSTGR